MFKLGNVNIYIFLISLYKFLTKPLMIIVSEKYSIERFVFAIKQSLHAIFKTNFIVIDKFFIIVVIPRFYYRVRLTVNAY